ncbi:MAG: hypothetical protein K1X65_19500 [Caldilineales bacterium]|nr:hypothetical protein [Caldilineales bacterium]MCW5857910.1 hypothetical protein [Caldilineales bacterium]
MRRFNRGYVWLFLAVLIVALLSVRWTHQQFEGRYQARMETIAGYTLDDWLTVLKLDDLLGDPPVTPQPPPNP